MDRIYFDNAATTRVCPEAAEAAMHAMTETYGNPSSTHTLGREAKALLDSAREDISAALGCTSDTLVFTSGGTESDNWAINGAAQANFRVGKHMITSLAEHDAVRKSAALLEKQGWEITWLEPERDGSVSVSSVEAALRPDTALVSLMLVNNETGGVTDVHSISQMLHAKNSRALLHTDAVQAFLKVPFQAKTLGADLISISGHKIHAPKGIGALYIRNGLRIPSYLNGGSQESGRRAGTEAVPMITAFATAARLGAETMRDSVTNMMKLREYLIDSLRERIPDVYIIRGGAPHILSISLPGYKSEVLMNYLESRNIFVSKSSACKKGARSHVLEAMKLKPSQIDGALRIGLSRYSSLEEAETLAACLAQAHSELFPVLR
ncbi:MAG: cysteine desulfurase [Oscillospiraceae bacterium]|nr:cysteine desulfurase [Oscillospiraceae bacterium]